MSLLATLLGNDSPPLPSLWAMQVGLRLGWATVLAWCALWCAMRLTAQPWGAIKRTALVVTVMLWSCLPGTVSPAFWLGLAFGAPSLVGVLLCAWLLVQQWLPPPGSTALQGVAAVYRFMGVLLGLILLLDWAAVLPWQLYARGFGPLAWGLVLFVSLVPCVLFNPLRRDTFWLLLLPLACTLFLFTRLPTGNIWDALLDPLLWLALCCRSIRAVIHKLRTGPLPVSRPGNGRGM